MNVFDLVWNLFEGIGENNDDFHQKLQDLDFIELTRLLQATAEALASEPSNSIKFALLLSFKKAILDFVVQQYPLLELKPFLVYLHPMECVYMILNSLPSDDDETWLDDDLEKAYSIFEYLVKWINWKIAENGDAEYYETYFQDYTSLERKRVMSSIGGDLLAFIARKAETKSVCLVLASLAEIIPLLNEDHLVAFWVFYKKIEGPIAMLMDSTTLVQRQAFLLNYEYPKIITPVVSGRLSFSGSPNTMKMNLEDNWKTISEGFCVEVGRRFINSVEEGESFLLNSCPLSIDLYNSDWELQKYDISNLSVVVRIFHFNSDSITNIMNSSELKDKQLNVIQTCIFQWAQGNALIQTRGLKILKELSENMLNEAVSAIPNPNHISIISSFLNIESG